MDFKYVLDPSAEMPIMLIDSHIGMDEADGEGIMGPQFVRELMFIDSLKPKCIQVWINSPGGVVTDGEQIFNAILKCNTPVDTYNVGTAASIAAPIFLAGRRRYMMDYAKIMVHPVSGGDKKSLKAFNETVASMLSSRSFITPEQAQKLMDKTTWINCIDAYAMGLCTNMEDSAAHNVKNMIEEDGELAAWKEYGKVLNKLVEDKKPKSMKKITNILNLNESASEDAIVAEVTKLKAELDNTKNVVTTNAENFKKMEDEYLAYQAKFKKVEDEYLALKKNKEEEEAKNVVTTNKLKEEAAKNLIAGFVKIGKVKNEAEVIAKWEKQAIANHDETKDLLDSLPLNRLGVIVDKELTDGGPGYTMASQMAEIKNKHDKK